METKLVIHCIRLEGLTITVSGADHSIPLKSDALRVTTLLGSIDYTLSQLPVTYDLADLNGNLTISDSSGRALYRWRLHPIAQPSAAENREAGSKPTYHLGRKRHSASISAPPPYRIIEKATILRSGMILNSVHIPQNATPDVETIVEDSDGRVRHVSSMESSLSSSGTESTRDRSNSPSPVRKSKNQTQRRLKTKSHTLGNSGSASLRLDTPPAKKCRLTVATRGNGALNVMESEIAPPSKSRIKETERIRLKDRCKGKSRIEILDMTHPRKVFLQRLVDRLLEENNEDSEPFAKPVDAVAMDLPTYHTVIKRAVDLRTLKENLGKGFYSTVEDFEADFNLMVENSIRFNGLAHPVSRSGLRLRSAFNALVASLPGRR